MLKKRPGNVLSINREYYRNDIVTLYTEDFRKAVDTYLDACEDATKTVLSRSWSAANWSDVLREVTAYNSKYFGETHSVRPRHEIRELGHEQKSTFVARSLPDEVFLNTLAGGIQLVLLVGGSRTARVFTDQT